MKIHRFIGDYQIKEGSFVVTDKEVVSQMRNVLKLHLGEEVIICDGRGMEGIGKIEEYIKNGVRIEILRTQKNMAEPTRFVTLYCAILKNENFEVACQKAVEVGVKRIVPISANRSVKKEIRYDRVRKIMQEAAEQSGRGCVPILDKALSLEDALSDAYKNSLNIFFAPEEQRIEEKDFVRAGSGPVGVFIGPEGGWDEEEHKKVKEPVCIKRGLGERILRGETAAIIAVFLSVYLEKDAKIG